MIYWRRKAKGSPLSRKTPRCSGLLSLLREGSFFIASFLIGNLDREGALTHLFRVQSTPISERYVRCELGCHRQFSFSVEINGKSQPRCQLPLFGSIPLGNNRESQEKKTRKKLSAKASSLFLPHDQDFLDDFAISHFYREPPKPFFIVPIENSQNTDRRPMEFVPCKNRPHWT